MIQIFLFEDLVDLQCQTSEPPPSSSQKREEYHDSRADSDKELAFKEELVLSQSAFKRPYLIPLAS